MDINTSKSPQVVGDDSTKDHTILGDRSSRRAKKARPRISAACVRCQRRKIRCDNRLPSCSGCQKAGIQCIDGGTARDIPRNYVSDLQKRVAWLESIIKERLPDIDLNDEPDQTPRNQHQDGSVAQQDAAKTCTEQITEQLGLISVSAGSDLRYFGPSSGLFFTKFVLTGLSQAAGVEASKLPETGSQGYDDMSFINGLIVPQPQPLPPDLRHAQFLSQAYFDSVHLQHPFLHQPTYMESLEKLYTDTTADAAGEFHVFAVLAIGATVLARRYRRHFSAEGFFASAMQRLETVFKVTSVAGIQSILLMEMYAMRNSSSGLNIWSLHQHSIATLIELGIHRDIPITSGFTALELEMRTRVFWSVYSMDRLISTTMGRPLALMDEQCDLRLPKDVNDEALTTTDSGLPTPPSTEPTSMSTAIHLFKLAKFVSEVKCSAYCVDREFPPYMSPAINDKHAWQKSILERLGQWRNGIPQYSPGDSRQYLAQLCEIRYHELRMLILRPSPLFPQPTKAAIRDCFASAIDCSKLYTKLNREKQLEYGWQSVHSLFLGTITMFYCVWTPNSVADDADFNFDCLNDALKSASDILSATGEYWPDANRSRDILDGIFKATWRYFSRRQTGVSPPLNAPQLPSTKSGVDFSNLTSLAPADQVDNMISGDVDFPLYAAEVWDSFMTTDWLSYFSHLDGAQMEQM